MAKLTFTAEELVEVAVSNGLMPPEIVRMKVKGERIHFVIKTGSFVLPFIPASLKYLRFDGDNAVFELSVVSSHATKAMGRLKNLIELNMPGYVKLEYPNVFVEINRLLEDKNVKSLRVRNISFGNGEFSITTGNN